jgi:pilus assembly protein TadC
MSGRLAMLGGIAGAAATWLVVGGWVGVGIGALVAACLIRALRRLEPPALRRDRLRVAADAPFAADLLAAVLRSGAPTEHGLRTVGMAIGDTLGRRLVRVSDGLRLGLEPVDAWMALRATAESARLADTVARTADSGAAVARALERLADSLRTEAVARVESAGQRLSVVMVLPLGLCFLPAFIFAGVVPVIIAVLGGVLHGKG